MSNNVKQRAGVRLLSFVMFNNNVSITNVYDTLFVYIQTSHKMRDLLFEKCFKKRFKNYLHYDTFMIQ
jgi:hypothetical protein